MSHACGWLAGLLVLGSFAPPAAAQAPVTEAAPEPESSSFQYLGPFEYSPAPVYGNLAAPRSAAPETRLGVGLHWQMASGDAGAGDWTNNVLSLLIEGHLELFDFLEVGVDFEVFDHHSSESGGTTSTLNDFGFIVPRAKVRFLSLEFLDVAAGVGVLLPTSTYEYYESNLPVAFDPGAYLAYRPLSWLSVNLTVPFVFWMMVPETGDTVDHYYFSPTLGATLMPFDFIGGFVDLQFHVWMNPEATLPGGDEPDPLRALNLMVGARSRPVEWLMIEAGAIVPLAGEAQADADIGLGARLCATPDLL